MTPTQPALFAVGPQPPTLTDRQAFALELLQRAGRDGLPAAEVGAALCERNGRHPAGQRCEYDRSNGLGVLRALRRKGVAKSRRDGSWYAIVGGRDDGAFGELPEGF